MNKDRLIDILTIVLIIILIIFAVAFASAHGTETKDVEYKEGGIIVIDGIQYVINRDAIIGVILAGVFCFVLGLFIGYICSKG